MTIQWRDTPSRYGVITRALHWSMALLFLWQFAMVFAVSAYGRDSFIGSFGRWHGAVGTLLLLLVTLRAVWALLNRASRPPHQAGLIGRLALAGHFALYGLMAVVPALALLRMYGVGRPFAPFGVPLFPGTGVRNETLMAPANALHSNLAWLLLALIAGHVIMALVHRLYWRDDVLQRMAGPPRPAGSAAARPAE